MATPAFHTETRQGIHILANEDLGTKQDCPECGARFYDLNNDPFEIHNLADDPDYAKQLKTMRKALDKWMKDTDDQGQQPESSDLYDSDMQVYLDKLANTRPEALKIIQQNIDQMKSWAAEGK